MPPHQPERPRNILVSENIASAMLTAMNASVDEVWGMMMRRDQEIIRMQQMLHDLKEGHRKASEIDMSSSGAVRFKVAAKVEMEFPNADSNSSTSNTYIEAQPA